MSLKTLKLTLVFFYLFFLSTSAISQQGVEFIEKTQGARYPKFLKELLKKKEKHGLVVQVPLLQTVYELINYSDTKVFEGKYIEHKIDKVVEGWAKEYSIDKNIDTRILPFAISMAWHEESAAYLAIVVSSDPRINNKVITFGDNSYYYTSSGVVANNIDHLLPNWEYRFKESIQNQEDTVTFKLNDYFTNSLFKHLPPYVEVKSSEFEKVKSEGQFDGVICNIDSDVIKDQYNRKNRKTEFHFTLNYDGNTFNQSFFVKDTYLSKSYKGEVQYEVNRLYTVFISCCYDFKKTIEKSGVDAKIVFDSTSVSTLFKQTIWDHNFTKFSTLKKSINVDSLEYLNQSIVLKELGELKTSSIEDLYIPDFFFLTDLQIELTKVGAAGLLVTYTYQDGLKTFRKQYLMESKKTRKSKFIIKTIDKTLDHLKKEDSLVKEILMFLNEKQVKYYALHAFNNAK